MYFNMYKQTRYCSSGSLCSPWIIWNLLCTLLNNHYMHHVRHTYLRVVYFRCIPFNGDSSVWSQPGITVRVDSLHAVWDRLGEDCNRSVHYVDDYLITGYADDYNVASHQVTFSSNSYSSIMESMQKCT